MIVFAPLRRTCGPSLETQTARRAGRAAPPPRRSSVLASNRRIFAGSKVSQTLSPGCTAKSVEVVTLNVWGPSSSVSKGDWREFRSGERFTGPAWITRSARLDEIPVFVRAWTRETGESLPTRRGR